MKSVVVVGFLFFVFFSCLLVFKTVNEKNLELGETLFNAQVQYIWHVTTYRNLWSAPSIVPHPGCTWHTYWNEQKFKEMPGDEAVVTDSCDY
jgi:ABC-type nitrate/sulfonate/bicarbonate transport system permease component